MVVLTGAVYLKELQLAYFLYRYEGGLKAFSSNPLSAHFVGMATHAPPPSKLFMIADSGGVAIATAAHHNGCFVLAAAKTPATLSSDAPGFMRVLAQVDGGYSYVRLSLSPAASGKPSTVSVTRISVWDFIGRTVQCRSSS
jgi:hypothetical protein